MSFVLWKLDELISFRLETLVYIFFMNTFLECTIFTYNYHVWTFEKVSCGNRSIKLRTTSSGKVKEWVAAINDAGLGPLEGWCHPHRFGSYAPPRGLTEDGSQAQWFIDGQAAFEAIASAIKNAKSQV